MSCGDAGASTDGSVLAYRFQDQFTQAAVGRYSAVRLISESLDENRSKVSPPEIFDSRREAAPLSGEVSTAGDHVFTFSAMGYDPLISALFADDERTGPFNSQVELDNVTSANKVVGPINVLELTRAAGDWDTNFAIGDLVQVEGWASADSNRTFQVTGPVSIDQTIELAAAYGDFTTATGSSFVSEAAGRLIRVTKVGRSQEVTIEAQPTGFPDLTYAKLTAAASSAFNRSRVGDLLRLNDNEAPGGLPSSRRQCYEIVRIDDDNTAVVRSFAREDNSRYEFTAGTSSPTIGLDMGLPMRDGSTCRSITWEREIAATSKLYDVFVGQVPNTGNFDLSGDFAQMTMGYIGRNLLPASTRQSTPDYYGTATGKALAKGGNVVFQRFGDPDPAIIQNVRSLSFTINNNIVPSTATGDEETGNEGPIALRQGSFSSGGSLTALLQGNALKDAFKSDATLPVEAMYSSRERHIYVWRCPEAGILTAPRPIRGKSEEYVIDSTFSASDPALAGYQTGLFRFLA